MTHSLHRKTADAPAMPTQSLRNKLMFAASAGILALVAPSGFYGMRAEAQANVLPDECDESDPGNINPNNRRADAGEIIECVTFPNDPPIDPISTTVADLTIQIGEDGAAMSSTVVGENTVTGPAVSMTGTGTQTLEIREGGSVFNDTPPNASDPTVNIDTAGSISLTNRGLIENQSDGTTNTARKAIGANVRSGGGALTIDSSAGQIKGWVDVSSQGTGPVSVNIGDLESTSTATGLSITANSTVTDVTVGVGRITSAGRGVYVKHAGSAGIMVQGAIDPNDATAVTGTVSGGADGVNLSSAGGSIAVQNLQSITGSTGDGILAQSQGGDISITNIDSATSANSEAIRATSGGGKISIQDVSVLEFDGDADPTNPLDRSAQGIVANSGAGNISIGALNDDADNEIGYIFSQGTGISATSTSGYIDITTGEAITAGGYGININSRGGKIDLTTNGTIDAGSYGIGITNRPTNANNSPINVTVNADVSGGNRIGVRVFNFANGTNVGNSSINLTLGENVDVSSNRMLGVGLLSTSAGASATLQGASSEILSGSISGATYGTQIITTGEIEVRDLASISATGRGLWVLSDGYAITIENIGTAFSQNDNAIRAASPERIARNGRPVYTGGGADISIQNVQVLKFDHDGNPATEDIASHSGIVAQSGTGNINIGALNDDEDNLIGYIFTREGPGINATAGGGSIDIATGREITAGGTGILAISTGDGNVDINAIGNVTAGESGIRVSQAGAGDVVVSANAVTATSNDGILIVTQTPTAGVANNSVTVNAAGAISAGKEGIDIRHVGNGLVDINAMDTVSGGTDGILFIGEGGKIDIGAIGAVTGGNRGINVRQSGAGDVVIAANEVTGTSGAGIRVETLAPTTGVTDNLVTVDAGGAVTGGTNGIYVTHAGSGLVDVSLTGANSSVTGTSNEGIKIRNSDPGAGIMVEGAIDPNDAAVVTGTVSGATDGMYLRTLGGAIMVKDLKSIFGISGDGIAAQSNGQAITIQNIGSVVSRDSNAIHANAQQYEIRLNQFDNPYRYYTGGGANISIQNVEIPEFEGDADPTNPLNRSAQGIVANSGAGNISIGALNDDAKNAIGNIFTQGTGISANSAGGYIDIAAGQAITAGSKGIYAMQSGAGDVDISANTVTGNGGEGIRVLTQAPTAGVANNRVTVNAGGAVTGNTSGIYVIHAGSGQVDVSLTGANSSVTGTNNEGIKIANSDASAGIQVQGGVDPNDPTVFTGTVSGGTNGVNLSTAGGAITIKDLKTISGRSGAGIYTRSSGGQIEISNVENVTSEGSWAINADSRNSDQSGGANISIKNVGVDKILESTDSSTLDVISANGIQAYSGTGNIDIGALNGDEKNAIRAIYTSGIGIRATSDGGNITVSTKGVIEAGLSGITTSTFGEGDTTIKVEDNIQTDSIGNGIFATTYGTGNIGVAVNSKISGGGIGIALVNAANAAAPDRAQKTLTLGENADIQGTFVGVGLLTSPGLPNESAGKITVAGHANSKISGGGNGLVVSSKTPSIEISDIGSISGGSLPDEAPLSYGLSATSSGGAISISNIGSVTSRYGTALRADTRDYQGSNTFSGGGADISIQNVAVKEFDDPNNPSGDKLRSANGIVARSGTGNVNIGNKQDNLNNNYFGTGDIFTTGTGIDAHSEGGYVQIRTKGVVTAGDTAIKIDNDGASSSYVYTEAAITAGTGAGISIDHAASAQDVKVLTTSSVSGQTYGIEIEHAGSELAYVQLKDVDSSVIGQTADGIKIATSSGSAANITVNGSVNSNTMQTYGTVSGGANGMDLSTQGSAITVQNLVSTTGGGDYGIRAQSQGGAITIENVVGVSSQGTAIKAETSGGDILIRDVGIPTFTPSSNGAQDRSQYGILAYSDGGNITIETEADIRSTGYAIIANTQINNPNVNASINVSVGNVTSTDTAIGVYNYSTDPAAKTNVTVSGDIAGAAGIVTRTNNGAHVTVTNTGTITRNTQNGTAVVFQSTENARSDDTLTLNGKVTGSVLMNTGEDEFEYGDTGEISEGSVVYGGRNNDTVSITSMFQKRLDGSGAAGDSIQEFEKFNFDGDNFTLAGNHVDWDEANFRTGTTFLDNNASLSATTGTIFLDATLHAKDQSLFNGNLINNGTLLIGDSPGLFTIDGNFTQSSTGKLPIEFQANAFDQLIITGTAELGGEIEFTLLDLLTPVTGASFPILTAQGGILNNSTFDTVKDLIPDIDLALYYDGNRVLSAFVAMNTPQPVTPPPVFGAPIPPPPPPPDDNGGGDAGDPGDGGEENPGDGGEENPGDGGEENPGDGGEENPGDGGEENPGDGGEENPGDGGEENPGDGGEENPGDGEENPGDGGEENPGDGGEENPGDGDGNEDPDQGGSDPDTPDPDTPDPDTPDPDTGDPDGDTGEDPTDPAQPEPEPEPEEPLLSPKEIAPSALMAGMFASDLFADSLIQRRGDNMSTGDWDFWVSGLGGRYDVGNNQEVYGWDGGTSGFGFGVQHLIEQGGLPVLFGLSTGFTESDVDSGFSHATVDSLHLGGFVNTQINGFFFAASASHAWQDYDLQRVFVFASSGAAIAVSETEGKSTAFKTEGYYDLLWDGEGDEGFGFGPLLTADLITGSYNPFRETGAGILNLSYDKETAQQNLLGAGVQGEYRALLFGNTLVDTGVRVLVESVSGDTSVTGKASLALPGAAFTPRSAKLDNQRLAFGADAKVYFSDKVYGHIRYDTTQSDQFSEHKGWAGITFKF
ncbi:MAG: hypothetical protein Hens2KO_13250 [Henriciella sp.]